MVLSIVIPAYNEERYIGELLRRVLAVPTETIGYEKEVIVIDDGSTDQTFTVASKFPGIKVLKQVPNQGKGKAVQRGIAESTGDFILIQDADLEYEPLDYIPMLNELKRRGDRASIYGSRILGQIAGSPAGFLRGKHPDQGLGSWAANRILSCVLFALYGVWLTDLLTAYKIYPGPFLRARHLKTSGFETDHEITDLLLNHGYKIFEVPIQYLPRSKEEGKKIKAQDGLIAVWTLLNRRLAK